MYPKMNCRSRQRLEFMHNIIDFPTITNNTKGPRTWQNLHQARKRTKLITFDLQLEYECSHGTKRFHCERQSTQSSHNHYAHNIGDLSKKTSWSLTQNYFLILVVITLHQIWPLFFLSMPCIFEEPWTLGNKGSNSNKTSP